MQQHSEQAVSLMQLQRALEIPLIEVWLGLLLGEHKQYQWEASGDFYHDARDILLIFSKQDTDGYSWHTV